MKKILLLLLCVCTLLHSHAQYNSNRNKVWTFGTGIGLNFNTGSPVPFSTSLTAWESSAAVSNSVGQLLFYTDGRAVYNRLGTIMPGGATIVPFLTESTTQGSVIVPFVGDTNKYYIFSLELFYNTTAPDSGRLAYTVIDMTLNGGLGGPVPGSVGIIFDSGMSEKMCVFPGNGCNMWLMTHKRSTNEFCAYAINSLGINTTPVISSVGSLTGASCYGYGAIKCSHDRQKIVTVTRAASGGGTWGVELYDLDPATAIVSNARTLALNPMPLSAAYTAEFSPDNTKLYATINGVYQWNLALSTTAAIVASKTLVSTTPTTRTTDIRLAPDGKIYLNGEYPGSFMDRINFPNLSGASCGYAANVINVAPGTVTLGLSTPVWEVQPVASADTVCQGMVKTLTAAAPGGTWSSSNSSIATIGASSGTLTGVSAGTTAISYVNVGGCTEVTILTVNSSTIGPISGTLAICEGAVSTLACSPSSGAWSSSAPAATISSLGIATGASVGTAIITYMLSGNCYSTAIVTVNPLPAPIVGSTTVAIGGSRTLSNATPGGTWSSSDITKATVNSTGKVTGVALGTSTIYYTLPTGCKVSLVINVVKNTGIDDFPGVVKPTLYPNPATDEIRISVEPTAFSSLAICNAVGQQVVARQITSAEMTVDLKALPHGEYQVIFTGEGTREMLRFTKW